jgi:hypothetical protein
MRIIAVKGINAREVTDMTEARVHFVEITAVNKGRHSTYRFYGRGQWEILECRKWKPINGIYIPARVLEIAAAQCHSEPPPILTEIDIARLCGGRY